MYMCVCMPTHACVCLWRPGVNTSSLLNYSLVLTPYTLVLLSLLLLPLLLLLLLLLLFILENNLSVNLTLVNLAILGGMKTLGGSRIL